jgi:hypothetical protein
MTTSYQCLKDNTTLKLAAPSDVSRFANTNSLGSFAEVQIQLAVARSSVSSSQMRYLRMFYQLRLAGPQTLPQVVHPQVRP